MYKATREQEKLNIGLFYLSVALMVIKTLKINPHKSVNFRETCNLYLKSVNCRKTCNLYLKSVNCRKTCNLYLKSVNFRKTCNLYLKSVNYRKTWNLLCSVTL
jgi:hypothetical protein